MTDPRRLAAEHWPGGAPDFSDSDLFGKLRFAFEQGLAPTVLRAPVFVLWEITGRCPQRCAYCYNQSPKTVPELSGRRLFEVADELIAAKVFSICLSGGEPMTREEYLGLLEYISGAGVPVGTVLSGAGITPAVAKRIARAAATVQISLDGATAEVHDRVRGRKGSFNDAVKAIQAFRRGDKPVQVAFAATRDNIAEFPKVYEFCCSLGAATVRTQKLVVSGKAGLNRDRVTPHDHDYQEFEIYCRSKEASKPPVLYSDPATHILFGLEYAMSVIARITAEGFVSPSPYLDFFFGDLSKESFSAVWERMKLGWGEPAMQQFARDYVVCERGVITVNAAGPKFFAP